MVLHMLNEFFIKTAKRKLANYHVYFDNFFTSFDLVLHLKKLGLRCTGTIRDNRVTAEVKNKIEKKKQIEEHLLLNTIVKAE